MEPVKRTSSARDRLLETADRLFYQEGIRAVGIDRIIAEAKVAKMSLYKHFQSKDDLILAVLQYREQQVLAYLGERMEYHRKRSDDPLKAFFSALRDWIEQPTFRGCAFINASVELANPQHAGFVFAREHKLRFQEFLRGLVAEAAGKAAASISPAICLLVEGAIVTAVIHGNSDAVNVARDAAMKMAKQVKLL